MLGQSYKSTWDLSIAVDEEETRRPFLPVLIIPGFMSSGLEIKESSLKRSWEGKRLWINLASLGFHSIHFGGAMKKSNMEDDDDQDEEHKQYRSLWIQHITLLDDMHTEQPGIKVRNIEGLAGVDYLTPGALMSMATYVFGPVIKALLEVGYEEGKNLDAAPYDWRLPPTVLEERDQYFTRTMKQVERMYKANYCRPVVLICHSLGCKTGHYFLNFAKRKAGQQWTNKYIHTYMPVGGPHLGAPKSLRSDISGDKMGLDTFLNDEEALAFGRSLGSGPWLFPSELPENATASAIVRKQGSLTVEIVGNVSVEPLLEGRQERDRPAKVKLMVKFGNKTLDSGFVTLDGSLPVSFAEKFVFATDPNRPIGDKGSGQLLVFLCEPGVSAARKSESEADSRLEYWSKKFRCCLWCLKVLTCYWLWCICFKLLLCLGVGLAKGTIETVDALAKASGGSSVLGLSDELQLPPGGSSEMEVELCHRNDAARRAGSRVTTCRVRVAWAAWKDGPPNHHVQCSAVCETHVKAPTINVTNRQGDKYVVSSGTNLLEREQLVRPLKAVASFYDKDALGPRSRSSIDAPPVQRVKAVYGINLPTEIGVVYKRRSGVVESAGKVDNYYKPDTSAKLDSNGDGYVCDNGVLYETNETVYRFKDQSEGKTTQKKISGDGTVPYWSLQHSRLWDSDNCKVTIDEIDGAEHREILADERFHEIVLDYITTNMTNELIA